MLSIQNLQMAYGSSRILERVSLEIATGEFCTIVGASGCGKSTFLRLILGQEQSTHGTILLDGEPVANEPGPDRGIVFQRYSVFPHLTTEQNLLLPHGLLHAPFTGHLRGAKRDEVRERASELLDRVGLAHARQRYPAQLSGGMQQRLALAQALMLKPRILLLDEPFGALDPGVRLDMHELLLEFWRDEQMTILMVTHDLSEAFKLGTRLLVFDKVRHDPQAADLIGATVTYDLPLEGNVIAEETHVPAPASEIAKTISSEAERTDRLREQQQELSP